MKPALTGFKGVAVWTVYNRIIFMLPFTQFFKIERRDFALELASALTLDDEPLRLWVSTLTEATLPRAMTQAQCLAIFKDMSEDERALCILECMSLTEISDDDVMRLLVVHNDANGITYNKSSIGNIQAADILPMMLESLLAASYVSIDTMLITSEEKKFLDGRRVDVKNALADSISLGAEVEEIMPIAIKKAVMGVMPND